MTMPEALWALSERNVEHNDRCGRELYQAGFTEKEIVALFPEGFERVGNYIRCRVDPPGTLRWQTRWEEFVNTVNAVPHLGRGLQGDTALKDTLYRVPEEQVAEYIRQRVGENIALLSRVTWHREYHRPWGYTTGWHDAAWVCHRGKLYPVHKWFIKSPLTEKPTDKVGGYTVVCDNRPYYRDKFTEVVAVIVALGKGESPPQRVGDTADG